MKIGVAQTRPVKGDIQANISNHADFIDLASRYAAEAIFFPELSLTGYEPTLAADLATDHLDSRFDVFQDLSDTRNIIIGCGMPTRADTGVLISTVIFQPHQPRQTYSKQHLHPDEYPFFVPGVQQLFLNVHNIRIAPAICYELSVPRHSEHVSENGTEIYVASVAKTSAGAEKASGTLSMIAKKYGMITLMSNCVGLCDGVECGGKTSVWNKQGVLGAQLDNSREGILVIDTETQDLVKEQLA